MSNVNTPFDSTMYTKVRGTRWAGDQAILVAPNTVVFKCRVNGAVTGGPAAQFNWDSGTIGAYTDVNTDQRLLISHVDDIRKAYYDGRVLHQPTSSIIYMAETGYDLDDDDYVFIVDEYPLKPRQARPTSTTPPINWKWDYDHDYEPLAPVPAGRMLFVGEIDHAGTGKLRVALDFSNSIAPDVNCDGTLAFSISFASGVASLVSGSLSSAIATVDVIEGHHWGHLSLEDSNGTLWFAHFEVYATGDTYQAIAVGASGVEIEGTIEGGYTCKMDAWAGVENCLNRTKFVVYRPNEWYSGVAGPLVAGNVVDFVGYIDNESNNTDVNPQYASVNTARLSFVSPSGLLAKLKAQQTLMRLASPASNCDEVDGLTTKRALINYWQRYSTYLNLYGLDFDSDTELFPRIPQQADNLLDAGRGILGKQGSLVFTPEGNCHIIAQVAGYLDATARAALLQVAAFTSDGDMVGQITVDQSHGDQTGYVDAHGATYNSTTLQETAYASIAPSTASTDSPNNDTIDDVILPPDIDGATAQALTNQIAGDLLSMNQTTTTLTCTMPDGLFGLVPTPNELYTIVYSDNERGIAYTTDDLWYLQRIAYTHDPEHGARLPRMIFKLLSPVGSPGDKPPDIAVDEVPDLISDFPPLDDFGFGFPDLLFPDTGLAITDVKPEALKPPAHYLVKIDGNTAIIGDDTRVLLVQHLIDLTYPIEKDITPPELGSFVVQCVMFDIGNKGLAGGNNYAFCLANDGTNSRVYVCPNVFSTNPFWQIGADVTGVFTEMRTTGTLGYIEIYTSGKTSGGGGTITITFDPTESDYTAGLGTLQSSGGNPGGCWATVFTGFLGDGISGYIYVDFASPVRITHTSMDWMKNYGSGRNIGLSMTCLAADHTTVLHTSSASPTTPNNTWSNLDSGAISVDNVYRIQFFTGTALFGGLPGTHTAYMDNCVIEWEPMGDGAELAVSSDRGLSFGTPIAIGGSPDELSGLDTQRAGSVVYTAAYHQVRKAGSLGGSFVDAPGGALTDNPVGLLVPWYVWGSFTSRNTTGGSPDYAVLTDAAGSSLKRITGGGTVTDITPVAGFQGDVANSLASLYGKYMAVRGLVSGNQKVYVTKNVDSATPTWTLVRTTTDCHVIKIHRSDTRPVKTGGGQLFIADVGAIWYTSKWIGPMYIRHLSITPKTMDIL